MSFQGHDPYPKIYRETWCSRGWLLVRKTERFGATTANDRRVAALLLRHSGHAAAVPGLARKLEAIAYGDS